MSDSHADILAEHDCPLSAGSRIGKFSGPERIKLRRRAAERLQDIRGRRNIYREARTYLSHGSPPAQCEASRLPLPDTQINAAMGGISKADVPGLCSGFSGARLRGDARRSRVRRSERDGARSLFQRSADARRQGEGVCSAARVRHFGQLSASPAQLRPCPSRPSLGRRGAARIVRRRGPFLDRSHSP
jgi:hypothetical protein